MDKKSVLWAGVIAMVSALIVIAWLSDPLGLTPEQNGLAPEQNGLAPEPDGRGTDLHGQAPDTTGPDHAKDEPGPAREIGHIPEDDTVAGPDAQTWRPAELFPATRTYQGPDFELEDITGSTVRLSDFEGSIIVLNLWATWCPPCRDEVPALIRLQEEFGDRGVQVIGVSLDENGARRSVADFANAFGVNYPTPVDDGRVQQKYGPLSVIPTTYFLDGGRNIRFYAPGYLEYGQMEEAVRELLGD
jgi:thiol-disulfide isomerase/thioredoxin